MARRPEHRAFFTGFPKKRGKKDHGPGKSRVSCKNGGVCGIFRPFLPIRAGRSVIGWVSRIFVHLRKREKLEFVEVSARPEQHCHSEPARTLVWESPSNSVLFIVIQTALFVLFSRIRPREMVLLTRRLPRQCEHWLAMTGKSIARQIPICQCACESR